MLVRELQKGRQNRQRWQAACMLQAEEFSVVSSRRGEGSKFSSRKEKPGSSRYIQAGSTKACPPSALAYRRCLSKRRCERRFSQEYTTIDPRLPLQPALRRSEDSSVLSPHQFSSRPPLRPAVLRPPSVTPRRLPAARLACYYAFSQESSAMPLSRLSCQPHTPPSTFLLPSSCLQRRKNCRHVLFAEQERVDAICLILPTPFSVLSFHSTFSMIFSLFFFASYVLSLLRAFSFLYFH